MTTCPHCQTTLPADAPGGLCPDCLLKLADVPSGESTLALFGNPGRVAVEGGDVSGPELDPLATDVATADSFSGEHEFAGQLGEFTLTRELGRGGMGTVYEARDRTGRRVALKILRHKFNSSSARARFLREGRAAAALNHPHTVYVYGTEEIGHTLVISMELVEGHNLHDLVVEQGSLPAKRGVDLILQVIDGLQAAAQAGVLHRDVKPSNCFVSDGIVKVGDFGLSISSVGSDDLELTREGVFLGTPAFASPEQLRGDALDVRSDIYSVGVTLYYLLTGTTPFHADNMVHLVATVLDQAPRPVCEVNRAVDSELSKVIQRCLSKKPHERYADYAELTRALKPFSSQMPEPALPALRMLAMLIDNLILSLPWFAVTALTEIDFYGEGTRRWMPIVGFLLVFAYFWGFEFWRRATPGKMLLGLRVIATHGERPTRWQLVWRSLCYLLFPQLLVLPANIFFPSRVLYSQSVLIAVGLTYYLFFGLMFSSMRRRNGFAGWHELWSDTRVVSGFGSVIAAVSPTTGATIGANGSGSGERIGPYEVLTRLTPTDGRDNVIGFDGKLVRRVLIRIGPRKV
ncbi:MAG: protein kinase, partial [Planctomycetales bacterium]|nr:protein kinase [Planctomycetales bacterium]